MITLSGKDRAAFWKRIDALGTPKARLLELHRRKAQWVKPGLVATVRHLRGEEKLRHTTLLSVRKAKGGPRQRSASWRITSKRPPTKEPACQRALQRPWRKTHS